MGFLTPALLAGAALVAVPILLHLVMRRQPRQLKFPALQFVRNRQEANRRKLNFRHLLLLALRCVLIAGFAFALARPTLKGTGLRGKEGAPLAVAIVVDNSLRMQYVHENRTRQEQAAEMATELINKFPDGTEVAIIDRSRSTNGFAADLSTAESRLRNLATESKPRPLEDALREAVELVGERQDSRQEVFLFTDLNATVWSESTVDSFNETLSGTPEAQIYLVDVGVDNPTNLAIGPLDIRQQTLRPGEPLRLNVPLVATGANSNETLLELFIGSGDEEPLKRGQQIVELSDQGQGQATFELGDLKMGTHQGYVSLSSSDPLSVDDTRYFTVEVRPPADILLLSENETDALFLRESLSPSALRTGEQTSARFQCVTDRFSSANELDFSVYAAVCLLDPPPLSEPVWLALLDYANEGGGVGVFLGERARASSFNEGPAQQVLPAELKRKSRFETYLRPKRLDHPALAALSPYAESIPWQVFPVYSYWEFEKPTGDSLIVARFANSDPALLVRPVGQGRSLTLATPVSDPPNPTRREPWNLLPASPWPFVPLMNQLVGYLCQSDADSLSFDAGETVRLYLPPNQRVSNFVLYPPTGQSLRRTVPPGEDAIRIGTTRDLGNYRVSSGGASGQLKRGFSVNLPADASRLDRVDPQQLLEVLPEQQVQLADTLIDVERYVDIGRSGRELFPLLISMVALVWGAEHVLANRFYREAQT